MSKLPLFRCQKFINFLDIAYKEHKVKYILEYKLICLYVNTPGCSASRGVPKLRKEKLSKVMNNYPPSFLWFPRVLGFLKFRYSSNMLP